MSAKKIYKTCGLIRAVSAENILLHGQKIETSTSEKNQSRFSEMILQP